MSVSKFSNLSFGNSKPDSSPNAGTYLDFIQNRRKTGQQTPVKEYEQEMLFLTDDEKMKRIQDIIWQISDTTVPVLITGESGVGKEVVAKAVHKASNLSDDAPFIAVNCAAMPATLLESELFGFEKGAFTGAHQRHIGKFEQANGGTILLDEITEMDAALQAKLLRVLQEKEIERLGGSGTIPINARIIATSNRDMVSYVNKGEFRQDLYYRLYVIHLEIPPLRERLKDVELLANHFLNDSNQNYAKQALTISKEALRKLQNHKWPGNVRELQNVIQRATLLAQTDEILASNIPIEVEEPDQMMDWVRALPIGQPLRTVETHFILETLKSHKGNRTHAAKTLGISLRTLRNKINEFTTQGFEVIGPMSGRATS